MRTARNIKDSKDNEEDDTMKQSKIYSKEPHYYSDKLKNKIRKIRFVPAAVVDAPSGYGKTTAIRDFMEKEIPQGTPVYWFTAVEETPLTAFRRLCREIDKIDSKAGRRLLKMELPNAATIGEASDALRSIRCEHEAYLVIDNFQFIQDALLTDFFSALLEHGGEGLHIVIITQMLKRDMLARITGQGILRITSADLRLSAEDINRYYSLTGVYITGETLEEVARYTEGWIIAVYLQLCAYKETGTFSDKPGILSLMEHLAWVHLTQEQKTFLLRMSPFEIFTMQQACNLTGCETLPEYAIEALESPFIRCEQNQRRYEMHSILAEMLAVKRKERGYQFERECLLSAGDLCRSEGRTLEALGYYWRIKDYARMLSLDLSTVISEEVGGIPFSELASDIAENCPNHIKKGNLLSMLQVAWALYTAGMNKLFDTLMKELHIMIKEKNGEAASYLLGEWMLLSSFMEFPDLERMTDILRQAEPLFNGKSSGVILRNTPWCFGSYCPLAQFHLKYGEADKEADKLEEYIALFSKLTNGHGSGADVLYRAELAFHRGNLSEAEILSYKAVFLAESKQQCIVHFGAALLLADVALFRADTAGWQHAIHSMERAASYPSQNAFVVRSVLDITRGVLFTELENTADVADWIRNGEFSERLLLPRMVEDALLVHMNYLMHMGEFTRLAGIIQALKPHINTASPFSEMLLLILEAVANIKLGNRDKAEMLVDQAIKRVLSDRLIFPLASYSWVLNELPDKIIRNKYPEILNQFNEIKERFASGWERLHKDMIANELPPDLTSREYEVAKLAAEGLRNSEIAEKLVVSECTVRAHLRTIFRKLDIDRRAKLAEKLK